MSGTERYRARLQGVFHNAKTYSLPPPRKLVQTDRLLMVKIYRYLFIFILCYYTERLFNSWRTGDSSVRENVEFNV